MEQLANVKKYAMLSKNWVLGSVDTVKGVRRGWWITGLGIIIFLIVLGSFYPKMIGGLVLMTAVVGVPWTFDSLSEYRKYTTPMAVVSMFLLILYFFEPGFAISIAIAGLLAAITTIIAKVRFLRYWMYAFLLLMVIWRPVTIHITPTVQHAYSDGAEDSSGEKNIAFLINLDTMKAFDVEVRRYEIFALLFSKDNRWKKFAKGNVLEVRTYGIRVKWFNWYPHVVYVKVLEEGKTKKELGIPLNLDS